MKVGKVIVEKDSLIAESRSLGSNLGQIPTLPTFKRRRKKVERIQVAAQSDELLVTISHHFTPNLKRPYYAF